MNKEQQKDKIILTVKKAINANMRRSIDGGYVELDDNDVDHIAEEAAEKLYNAGYRKTHTSELASDTQKAFKEGYIKGIEDRKAELDLAKAFHDEKCAEFDKLCYDYRKLKTENERLKSEKVEYEKPIDKFIKDREVKAVKEFTEKLKEKALTLSGVETYHVCCLIDELLKEFEQ